MVDRTPTSSVLWPDPERARSERFLVTGSEGCIGAWVVSALVSAGCHVVAADLPPAGRRIGKVLDPGLRARVDHVDCDVTEAGALAALVRDRAITRVIHLAALQVPFVAADPVLGARVNVIGTLHVLEAVRSSGGTVRGVAYASSTAATGPDEAPHEPLTLYGAFKLCNEHTARLYEREYATRAIGLRPCVVYGPARDQGLTAALTHALKAAVLGVPYEIPFGGLVDAQYVEDVAAAFVRCALHEDDAPAAVYDLHGDAVSVADYVATIDAVLPQAAGLVTYVDRPIPGNVVVDDDALEARVGALPKTALAEGVRRSAALFARHRDAGLLDASELPLPAP